MTPEQKLIEELADKEHVSWARWVRYLFTRCYETYDGNYVIPCELVDRWRRQMNTPYAELSEQEKQSDRNEVAHILPIIYGYWEGNGGTGEQESTGTADE